MLGWPPASARFRAVILAFALAWGVMGSALANLPLRVACFNVQDGLYAASTASYQDTATILKRINADVVGLCELIVTNGIRDDVNFPVLAMELELQHTIFDTNNFPATYHRAGIASRYPIAQTIWVFGSGMTRRIPLARIVVPGAAKPVWVAMLHLKCCDSVSRSEQHQRAAELFWLRQAILANCDVQNENIVIMGDFNLVTTSDFTFETPLYSGVIYPLAAPKDADGYFVPEQIFKVDARHAGPGGETYTWLGDSRFDPGALDHIMVNAPLRTLGVASEIYDIQKDGLGIEGLPKYGARPPPNSSYGSDHLPIFADLQLADAPPAQFRVLPGEDFLPVVRLGGDFGAVQKVYAVTNDKTTPLQWFVWKSADWFDVSPGEGGVDVSSQTSVTVSLNARAASLPAGEHTAEILFTDSITGSVVTRIVSLRVMDQELQIDAPTTVTSTLADTYRYEGSMDRVLVNGLTWSNRANGLTGTVAYSPRWSADIPLVRGTNVVDFRGVYPVTNAPTLLAADGPADPAYANGWFDQSNGGQGFEPWRFARARGWAGSSLFGTNVFNVPPSFGGAFVLWAMGDGVTTARRAFDRALTTNDTFHLQFDNNWIEPGQSVGFALTDAAGTKRLDFYFVGWEMLYRVRDADGNRVTDLPYTDQGMDLAVQLVGENGYLLTAGTNVITGSLAPGGPVSAMVATNNGSGPGTSYDFYLGAMRIEDSAGTWASDGPADPAYTGRWTNGSQGGVGFQPWEITATGLGGNGGHIRFGTDIFNVTPSFGGAFSLWASGAGYSEARRPFTKAMEVGEAFVLQFDNNLVEEGKLVGFSLADASGVDRFGFLCYGGQQIYWVSDAADPRVTTLPVTQDGIELRFELTGENSYVLSSGNFSFAGTLAPGGAIKQLRAFNYGSGVGTAYDFYLGGMRLEAPSTTLVEVQATAPAVIREVNPAVFTGPAEGRQFVAGSEIYLNAQLGAETVGMDLIFNGVVTEWAKSFGDTYAVKVGIPGPGVITTVAAVARDADGLTAPQVERQYSGGAMLNPLPQVSMLPSPGVGPILAGHFVVLRAQALFSNTSLGAPSVDFYANGVHIGTGRHTSGGVYELVWRTPVEAIDAKITAQATQADHLNPQTGAIYYAASISSNDTRIETVVMDEVTLSAGRTKFEVVAKKMTWPEAHADAVASGGRLAILPYKGFHDKVIAQVRSRYSDALWLGLTDQDQEGVWRWIDGTPLIYDGPWNAGEPNDWNGNEDYTHVWWGTTAWNDNGGVIPAYLLEKAPVELSSLPVSSGGWPWFSYWWSEDAADSKDVAVVMTDDGESSWREYTFTGPVQVRFQWKVSSEAGDTFSYAVNGETIKSISGETAWSTETIKLPGGTHTIRWTYNKDASGLAGWDAGFLDCLEFWNNAASPLGVKLGENAATFAVWAPNATAVSVVGDFNNWTETPLESDAATGHWTGTVPDAKHGDEYQYLIRWPGNESGRLKNDPRADWIRNGRSVVYDHSAFDWGAGFVPRTDTTGLVYELHIGTFNNTSPATKTVATFDDAIQRLDYLQQLGVDIIALMPVTEYGTDTSWGYNPAYLFAVENDYGGPDGLKRFIKAAHASGMKVQLDIVHNHYIEGDYRGQGNDPTNEPELLDADGPGLLEFDGPEDIYFYGRHDLLSGHPDQPKRAAFKWGPRPDFSQPEVRRYVEDNVRHWLDEYRIDGFRWDSPKNILGYDSGGKTPDPDTLLPEAKAMMAGINRMIHERYPGRWTIAEEPGLLVAETPSSFPQFYHDAAAVNLLEEFDGHWQYGFHDAVTNNLASPGPDVWGMLQRVMNTSEKPGSRVIFTDSHDLAGDLNDGWRWPYRVGEADPDSRAARKKSLLGAVLALTAPGSPMLLMGQEFHATGQFGDRIPLDWSKAANNHRLFRAYRDLINLRRDFASLRSTTLSSTFGANNTLGVGRYWRGSDVVVVFNMSSQPLTDARFYFPAGGQWFVRVNTDATIYGEDFGDFGPAGGVVNVTAADNSAAVPLAPYSAMVLTRTPPLPATEDFVHGFKHVNETGADDFLVETVNARKHAEWQDPPITYWAPATNEADASVTYRFSRPGPILSASAFASLVSVNFSAQEQGSSSLWASKDGQNWALLRDNPVPVGRLDSYVSFNGALPAEVLGSRDLWLQVRLRTVGSPLGWYSTAQFGRASSANTSNVFQVQLQSATAAHEDADGDGLPDSWETITGATDPDADDDSDGLTNLREYLSGLDPKVFNPDAVVGSFNGWNPIASPLTVAVGDPTQRGHLRFSRAAQSGQFRWLLGGIYYGAAPEAAEPVEGGAPIAYEAPAGTYVYFSTGTDPASAAAEVIDPASPLDADGNLLDDRWQAFYGVSDPNGDADGDTMSNLREFLRGSDPLVARAPAVVGDRLPLAWTPDAPQLQMRWSESRQCWEWTSVLPAGPLKFKFAMGPGWMGENHGVGGVPGRTDPSGGPEANIVETLPLQGRYRFFFNEVARTYSLQHFPRRAEWREIYDLDEDASWSADTDMDGANDLLEYALGGNPRRPDVLMLGPGLSASPVARFVRNANGEFIFSWVEIDDPDVVVIPEVSEDLAGGLWVTSTSETSPDQAGVAPGHIRKNVSLPSGSPMMFLRLRAAIP